MLKENVHLELLYENSVKLAIVLKGSKFIQPFFESGGWMGINASAGSKAILAFLTPNRLKEIKKAHPVLQRFRPKSITDWSALEQQLEDIRKAGIAYDNDEHIEGVYAVAAPIFDFSGVVIGAVAVPVPVHRKAIIFKQETINSVKETAKNITASLMALPAE
jgi:DNA-binding IclR family transcriptional regulator